MIRWTGAWALQNGRIVLIKMRAYSLVNLINGVKERFEGNLKK